MAGKMRKWTTSDAPVPANKHTYLIWNGSDNSVACTQAIATDIARAWATQERIDPIAQQDLMAFSAEHAGKNAFVSFKSALADYLHGAGMALNPLAQEQAHFYETDDAALLADWQNVVTDMYVVCTANDSIKNWMHERAKNEQPARRSESTAKRAPGVKVDT
jgi:hypothetical protein